MPIVEAYWNKLVKSLVDFFGMNGATSLELRRYKKMEMKLTMLHCFLTPPVPINIPIAIIF
jgi:hypothetical protein